LKTGREVCEPCNKEKGRTTEGTEGKTRSGSQQVCYKSSKENGAKLNNPRNPASVSSKSRKLKKRRAMMTTG